MQLQKQMHGLQLDRIMGSKTTTGTEHPYHTLCLRSLKAQVKALQPGSHDEKSTTDDGKRAVYEVYTKTEAAKFAHLSKARLAARAGVDSAFYSGFSISVYCKFFSILTVNIVN